MHPLLKRILRTHQASESAATISAIVAEHQRGRAHEIHVDRRGRLVDGRLVAGIYAKHGWTPRHVPVDDEDVLWTILTRNFGRHLSPEERLRGLVTARAAVAKLPPAHRKGRKTRDLIAELTGGTWSSRSVQKAINLHRDAPAVFEQLGKMGLEDCVRIATLPAASQDRALAAVRRGNDPVAAWRQQRDADVLSKARRLAVRGRKYSVIMADPPWPYDDAGVARRGAAATHYPAMPLDELRAMAGTVEKLASENAVLLLWATAAFLEEALALMRAWGFTFKQEVVWKKTGPLGNGHAFRLVHEPLLVGIRGMWLPVADHSIPSVIEAPRGQHSAKPNAVYEAIERLWPRVSRLELFARAARPGWDRWGAEAP